MLKFDSISHHYGRQQALTEVSFSAAQGAITCLIGPSGCGKSTLLRLAAGLMPLQSGYITLNDDLMAKPGLHVPPEKRPIGLVFQEGALFPHLSVRHNVGFGLKGSGKDARVDQLLADVNLSQFADRYPHSLSGGQRQRVALARAIAPSPRALLFDEPYANLDMQLRRVLRDQARQLIQRTDSVGIFVTHDPDEVMAIADHVVVLEQGQVVQQGSPRSLYDEPQTLGVAQLFGHAQTVKARVKDNHLETAFGVWPLSCLAQPLTGSGDITLVVRPERLTITPASEGPPIAEVRAADNADMLEIEGNESQAPLKVLCERPHEIKSQDRVSVMPHDSSVFAEIDHKALENKNDSY